ncbi:MAG: hydroxyacylglutathione hydrolase [Castellaniella sp.]
MSFPAPTGYDPARQGPQLIALPAFSDNYIWMVCHRGHAVVIDPGQAAPVSALLRAHDLVPEAILLTHHHHDHVGGVVALHEAFSAPVYGPASESLPLCDHRLAEGDRITLPRTGLQLSVLDVPGHTAGHIAYHGKLSSGVPVLFCGDTLFAAGCGRLFEGTPAQMHASLAKLAALPSDTLVCCAHEYTLGNLEWALAVEPDNTDLQQRHASVSGLRRQGLPSLPPTLQQELATNPFLRTAQAGVAAAAGRFAGRALPDDVAVFASLREWKNQF